ncbi:MAG: twin-arginine translocase subunit TatB [Gammaproteobacteria bacterium]|nr:MAG: twin-arginine translocase subunit TatB [Gammaproteobacteria bacterium]RLA51700.1 MAG: twin-arginine translocase subunit TatB [Gammaproteobacteria bacterium]
MFDMGFAEILMIAVIGLIVIGPKRMPEAIRIFGYWLGKLRRTVHSARQEMEREFGLDDIRRELHNESLLADLNKERLQIEDKLNSPPRTHTNAPPADTKSDLDKESNEQEMLQAFDDFDKEFGVDTSVNDTQAAGQGPEEATIITETTDTADIAEPTQDSAAELTATTGKPAELEKP